MPVCAACRFEEGEAVSGASFFKRLVACTGICSIGRAALGERRLLLQSRTVLTPRAFVLEVVPSCSRAVSHMAASRRSRRTRDQVLSAPPPSRRKKQPATLTMAVQYHSLVLLFSVVAHGAPSWLGLQLSVPYRVCWGRATSWGGAEASGLFLRSR